MSTTRLWHSTLTERFVDHRRIGLASQAVAKLALHHAESGLDITALVVVLDEFVSPKHEVVKHFLPRPATSARSIRFERYKRRASCVRNRVRTFNAGVSWRRSRE